MSNINLNNANATNKKITDLYGRIKENKLILQPDFQRKFVWNVKHRKQLIQTILKGLPFPEIYIADEGINLETLSSQEVVVDGQQRLTSIVQYIDGDLPIKESDIISPFSSLNPKEKSNFLNYKVTVRELSDVDSDTIKEVFKRINLTKYSLNNYEIHNAIYDGEYISVAKELLESKPVQAISSFELDEFGRMQELGLMLVIMSTIEEGGYFNADSEVETYLKRFNDEYPNRAMMVKRIGKAAKVLNSLALESNSTWLKKSNLFTLFIVLSSVDVPDDFKPRLIDFEKRLIANKDVADKDKNDFSLYYFYTVAGTNSRKARVTRDNIFRKHVLKELGQ